MATREASILNCLQYTKNLYLYNLLVAVSFTCLANAQQNSSATVRLSGGGASWRGTVEVYYNGEWGTVCHESFDLTDGGVVCRQLGFFDAREVYDYAHFGTGEGFPHLIGAECNGSESHLQDCPGEWRSGRTCYTTWVVGVACIATSGAPNITLVGGAYPNQGRVEIYLNGQWGTVCDTFWEINSASVVCRQLGYESAVEAVTGNLFAKSENRSVLLDEIDCFGDEISIYFCNHKGVGNSAYECRHTENNAALAGVVCKSDEYPNYVADPTSDDGLPVWTYVIFFFIGFMLCGWFHQRRRNGSLRPAVSRQPPRQPPQQPQSQVASNSNSDQGGVTVPPPSATSNQAPTGSNPTQQQPNHQDPSTADHPPQYDTLVPDMPPSAEASPFSTQGTPYPPQVGDVPHPPQDAGTQYPPVLPYLQTTQYPSAPPPSSPAFPPSNYVPATDDSTPITPPPSYDSVIFSGSQGQDNPATTDDDAY